MTPPTRQVWHVRNADLFGGPERLILDQMRFAGPGYALTAVSFVGADGASPFLETLAAAGLRTKALRQRSSYDLALFRRFRALVKAERPTVLVGHDYKANLLVQWAARRTQVARVALVHGYTGEDQKIRFFEAVDRHRLRRMDAVATVSQQLASRLAESRVPVAKIHVVPGGIDANRAAETAQQGGPALRAQWTGGVDRQVVLSLGRLSPEKGHDLLLAAWAALGPARGDALLVLVGDGAARGALERQAEALGIDVRFEGWRTDPHACLGAADLLVLPSRTEGLPIALLEAMAIGTAVIATDVGDVAFALGHVGRSTASELAVLPGLDGPAGVVVPPEDVPSLTDALRTALADPEAREQHAVRAAQRVRETYAGDAQARALETIYASLSAGA